jgi:acyl-coenzyme A thioesterase PaaI-like protein
MPIDPRLSVERRALAALARTRAMGLHFLGHFVGITATKNGDGESTLVLEPPAYGPAVVSSAVEQSALADLTMGSAIRSVLGPGLRLGTTCLSVNHLAVPSPGGLEARATTFWRDTGGLEGYARCEIFDSAGQIVVSAEGWFVSLPAPPGQTLPPVPWETEPSGADLALTAEKLREPEQAVLDQVLRAAARAGTAGTSVMAQLVAPEESPVARPDEVGYSLPVGPALGNRVGQMQGGALYGAAGVAAEAALGPGWSISSGYAQFLRPVDAPSVDVSATVTRRGRRTSFTEATISAHGRTSLLARFTHRPFGTAD